jgi:hypothetical protein
MEGMLAMHTDSSHVREAATGHNQNGLITASAEKENLCRH